VRLVGFIVKKFVKVNFTIRQAMKGQSGGGNISVLFLWLGVRWGELSRCTFGKDAGNPF